MYEDGMAIFDCDMSGLPDDLHALQWDGSKGHIEYTDDLKLNVIVSSQSQIESALGVSLSTLKERRTARKTEQEAEEAASEGKKIGE